MHLPFLRLTEKNMHRFKVAAKRGFKVLAITDHGYDSGALEFYKAATEKGVAPIIGCEFYCQDGPSSRTKKGEETGQHPLTVPAKNYAGLCSIFDRLSKANQQFYRRPPLRLISSRRRSSIRFYLATFPTIWESTKQRLEIWSKRSSERSMRKGRESFP